MEVGVLFLGDWRFQVEGLGFRDNFFLGGVGSLCCVYTLSCSQPLIPNFMLLMSLAGVPKPYAPKS